MKFWNVIVMEKYTTVFQKRCMTVKEANDLLKAKKLEFPAPQYQCSKEQF